MVVLLWIVRVYMWIIIIWALSSWIGFLPGIPGLVLHLLTWPVWGLFGWASIGSIGFAPWIALILLGALEGFLKRHIAGPEYVQETPDPFAGEDPYSANDPESSKGEAQTGRSETNRW